MVAGGKEDHGVMYEHAAGGVGSSLAAGHKDGTAVPQVKKDAAQVISCSDQDACVSLAGLRGGVLVRSVCEKAARPVHSVHGGHHFLKGVVGPKKVLQRFKVEDVRPEPLKDFTSSSFLDESGNFETAL
jgi:hypothetical protein